MPTPVKKLSLSKVIAIVAIVLIAAATGYSYFGPKKVPTYDYILAEKKDLIQQVSVTGHVKPAESLDLAFERSGKVANISANVGDKVAAGQVLAKLDDSDIRTQLASARAQLDNANAQLGQYQAALQRENAKLDQLKRGTRTEELKIAETAVANAQKALSDTQTNLQNVKDKAKADLDQDYDGALNAASKSISVATNTLFVVTDIQFAHFFDGLQIDIKIADAKAQAVSSLLGGVDAGRMNKDTINQLNGGAKASVETAMANPSTTNSNKALADVYNALNKVKDLLDTIPITLDLTSAESTDLATEKTGINNEIITITTDQKAISVQKVTNDNNISAAQMKVNDATNALATANDTLALKQAGSTAEDIAAQQAQVQQAQANVTSQQAQIKQAQANISNYEVQLSKTLIHSSIDGTVTKQDAKVGEIVAANTPLISVISSAKYQIEANIAEADIAKVKVGDQAKINLDAYGSDVIFNAQVVSIDPGETVIEGVATYKTTFQLISEDERLKPGMTANIDVETAKKENAIAVPQRSIADTNGAKTVQILNPDGTVRTVNVTTGLKDSEGYVEITSGINEGDKVIVYTPAQ